MYDITVHTDNCRTLHYVELWYNFIYLVCYSLTSYHRSYSVHTWSISVYIVALYYGLSIAYILYYTLCHIDTLAAI